jgi:hypothetical protein
MRQRYMRQREINSGADGRDLSCVALLGRRARTVWINFCGRGVACAGHAFAEAQSADCILNDARRDQV